MPNQIVDQYPDAQLWITNDPDNYSNTYRNRAGPNTAGKGNVGGQTHDFRDSQDNQIGTIDDRGFLSSRAVVGITGEIKVFPKSITNSNLLRCDGSAVSRTVYANLFAYLGTTFGVGDGLTTFNLPDYRDVAFGGIGPSLFLNPQTVYGTNSPVDISHLHTGSVHTHPSSAHSHPHSATHNHSGTTSSDGTGSTSADGGGSTSSDGAGATGSSGATSTSSDGAGATGSSGTGSTSTDGAFGLTDGPSNVQSVTDDGTNQTNVADSNHTHHTADHNHTGPSHTHTGPSHNHTIGNHTHTGPSHNHTGPVHSHNGPAHTHTVTTTSVAPGTSDSTTPADTGTASAANTGTGGTTTLSVIQATMGFFVYIII